MDRYNKDELERLILQDKKSYEAIGRYYGVTGNAIKKAAKKMGINLLPKRKINPKEQFAHIKTQRTDNIKVCHNCGKQFKAKKSSLGIYCSQRCQLEYQYKDYITKWKNGEVNGIIGGYSMSHHIRKYFFDKYNYKCQKCGWGKINPHTNKVPLQLHHIDGNSLNNKEENLQLLCPNCHSLTENFGSRNKNATTGRSSYFGKSK